MFPFKLVHYFKKMLFNGLGHECGGAMSSKWRLSRVSLLLDDDSRDCLLV